MFTHITVKGGVQYVGVDERLRWARHDCPDLQQTSEQLIRTDDYAEFKVVLIVPANGARAEGHGDCYRSDFNRFVQKAEENAVGNALDHLGYSSEAALAYEKRHTRGGASAAPQRTPSPRAEAPDHDV